MFLVSSDKYPEVELLDHMVILLLIFWGISILFSIVASPVYIPGNSEWGFLFSTSSPKLVICCLFDNSHLDRCEVMCLWFWSAFLWWLEMLVLSIFSCACWPSVCLLWKKVCLGPLPLFKWRFFFFNVKLNGFYA